MKGYLNNDVATKATVRADGFLMTGDVVYVDEEGFFFVVDRVKELIKTKGFQVPPAELEALLLGHPGIADAAVIGVPDTRAGELAMGFVVKKDAADETLDAAAVKAFLVSKGIAKYKQLD
jgi:acyl-CoA synthetase (AMP-forming)/AMP-acid ligase II